MSVIEYGNPISFAGGAAWTEPLWRWAVTDLSGNCLTFLDKLASDRQITFKLNEATEITCTVPSDNPEVNILHTDGYPFIAEGVRQIYCFRRESNTSPYYVLRASGLILQVDDAAASDTARTRITAWDPWKMLEYRPVMARTGTPREPVVDIGTDAGLTYDESFTAAQIVTDILTQSFNSANARKVLYPAIPTASLRAFIDSTHTSVGTFATPASVSTSTPKVWEIHQGTSVAAALQDLCKEGFLDILMTPYRNSPANPNGYMSKLVMYSQAFGGDGAGTTNYRAQFAWDRPGRNVVGIDDLFDGTMRANMIDFHINQGGPAVGVRFDPVSLGRFGEYWAQQWWPDQSQTGAVGTLADQQLDLRKNFKQTLTVHPASSGRAPDPFLDYTLGDRVPIYASNALRQALPPGGITIERGGADGVTNGTSTFTAASGAFSAADVGKYVSIFTKGYFRIVAFTNSTTVTINGAPFAGTVLAWQVGVAIAAPVYDPPIRAWQRIYGIPLVIDDNGTETVSELLVGPVGGPVIGPTPPLENEINTTTALSSSLANQRRVGSLVSPGRSQGV